MFEGLVARDSMVERIPPFLENPGVVGRELNVGADGRGVESSSPSNTLFRCPAREVFTHLVYTASLFEDGGMMACCLDGNVGESASYDGYVALFHVH